MKNLTDWVVGLVVSEGIEFALSLVAVGWRERLDL